MLKKMRQCRLNFAENRYDCEAGIIGEHYATELIITPPAIMPDEAVYRLCFEPGGLSEIILQTTDGAFAYPLPSAVTATPYCCVTLIGYVGSEQIYKSRMVRLHFSQTADGDNSIDLQQPGIVDEVNQNTAARHSHANKAVLDKFAESDGKPTYDGKALGDGSEKEIFKIPVTITELADPADGESFKVEHTVTLTELDAATKEGKTLSVLADRGGVTYNLPLFYYVSGTYCFYAMLGSTAVTMVVALSSGDEGETPKEVWQYTEDDKPIDSKDVTYYNHNNTSLDTAQKALDKLLTDSHTHANKVMLDKLSDVNGKLQYNGSDVGLKGDKGDTGATGADGKTPVKGVDYWTAADKQEIIDDIHPAYYIDLAGTYPNYTCPVTMDDIKAAYNSGYNLVCRCQLGVYTATLPLFVPMPAANTWLFSGSGALADMSFHAQSFTIAIAANGVVAEKTFLNEPLKITAEGKNYTYDGSDTVSIAVKTEADSVTTSDGNIALADNTEYRLADVTTLTLTYPTLNFECWMRLKFAASGNVTVTLPTGTKYIGTAPDFKNGETWELSFKDKVLAAQKVGEGT